MSQTLFKDKYLKYKKKYLNLQYLMNQLAGAQKEHCNAAPAMLNNYPDVASSYSYTQLNNYFTNPTYGSNTGYTTGILPNFNIQFQYRPTYDFLPIPQMHAPPIIPPPPALNTFRLNNNIYTRAGVPAVGHTKGDANDTTTYIYYHNNGGIKTVDCPRNEIHITQPYGLLSSIIGKVLKLRCNDDINLTNNNSIISDLTTNRNKKILVIDWQNIISDLLQESVVNAHYNYPPNNYNYPRYASHKSDIKIRFNFFLYNNIVLKNNYVFIVFKKSNETDINFLKEIINGPYDLKNYINDTNSRLQIIITSIATKSTVANKSNQVLNYYNSFTNPNFETNHNIIWDYRLTSSFDDFVFWIIVVFIYNLVKNKIRADYTAVSGNQDFIQPNFVFSNLEVYTIDKQKLSNNCQDDPPAPPNPFNFYDRSAHPRNPPGPPPTADHFYFDNITRIYYNPNRTCKEIGSDKHRDPDKNLFNMVYPSLTAGLDSNQKIYSYYLNFNSGPRFVEYDNIIEPQKWFYSNDKLLNDYIEFILKLFGHTPIKLNPRPANLTLNAYGKFGLPFYMNNYRGGYFAGAINLNFINNNYWIFQNNRPVGVNVGKRFNDSRLKTKYIDNTPYPNINIDNIEPIVALWEKFNDNNNHIELFKLRTDTIYFLLNNFPIRGNGHPNQFINIMNIVSDYHNLGTEFDFLNDSIHPGLVFYAQIKNIQTMNYPNTTTKENIHDDLDSIKNLNKIMKNIKTQSLQKECKQKELKNNICESRNQIHQYINQIDQLNTQINNMNIQPGNERKRRNITIYNTNDNTNNGIEMTDTDDD